MNIETVQNMLAGSMITDLCCIFLCFAQEGEGVYYIFHAKFVNKMLVDVDI